MGWSTHAKSGLKQHAMAYELCWKKHEPVTMARKSKHKDGRPIEGKSPSKDARQGCQVCGLAKFAWNLYKFLAYQARALQGQEVSLAMTWRLLFFGRCKDRNGSYGISKDTTRVLNFMCIGYGMHWPCTKMVGASKAGTHSSILQVSYKVYASF